MIQIREKTVIFLSLFFLIAIVGTAKAETSLKFEKVIFHSSGSDEFAHSMEATDSSLYVVGSQSTSNPKALVLGYAVPPTDSPLVNFQLKAASNLSPSDVFTDLGIAADGLYFVGKSYLKKDLSKPFLAKLAHGNSTGTPVWFAQPLFFDNYTEGAFQAVLPVDEAGSPAIYAAGYASTSGLNRTAVLTKYDKDGNALWSKNLSGTGNLERGSVMSLAAHQESIVAAGFSGVCVKDSDFNSFSPDLTLWKLDALGNEVWTKKISSFPLYLSKSEIKEVRSQLVISGDSLYIAATQMKGNKATILVLKYDLEGNLVWESTWNPVVQPLTSDMSFASSLSAGSDRLYVAGWTEYTSQTTQEIKEDAFVLEVDQEHGVVLASHNYGDPNLLERALGVQVLGSDVYVTGLKASLASQKKKTPSEIFILHYKIQAPQPLVIEVEPIDSQSEKITVIIFSNENFHAPTTVNTQSITFGPVGNEPSWDSCGMQDKNGDGILDLFCYFKTEFEINESTVKLFKNTDTQGILKGEFLTGMPFYGVDSVSFVTPSTPTPTPEPTPIPEPTPTPEPTPSVLSSTETVPSPEPAPGEEVPAAQETVEAPLSDSATTNELASTPSVESVVETETPEETVVTSSSDSTSTSESSSTTSVAAISEPETSEETEPAPSTTTSSSKTTSATSPISVPASNQPTVLPDARIPSETTPVATEETISATPSDPGKLQESVLIRKILKSLESLETSQKDSSPSDAPASHDTPSGFGTGLARAYNDLGTKALKEKKWAKAVAYFKEALRLEPKSAQSHKYLGVAFMKAGKLKEAEEHLTESLNLNPEDKETKELLDWVVSNL